MSICLCLSLWCASGLAAAEPVRVAVLKYGTVSWALEVVKRRHLDEANGFVLDVKEFAGTQATLVALQGGEADVAVTDWIWVARQRDQGRPYTFVPYSTAIGSLMAPPQSEIRALADLNGKRVGVAGGPLDKNWLLLRALSLKETGVDLESRVEPVFGAPPLLNEQIRQGRIDAVVNHWPFAARLSALGYVTVEDVRDAGKALGIDVEVAMIGYVFDQPWAETHPDAIQGFLRATEQANTLLKESDAEWEQVLPLMAAPDEPTFIALRDGYRAGIPDRRSEQERAGAAQLFEILGRIGGERLVGGLREIPEGTFWSGVED
ncbi:ABC transporter substrate-binding protein [Thiocapsa rosea]|uniref:ABC transporter substrate-binding protein n=1 Tax=Thiocapsa rosea TaxID=69360 RepID=UPI001FE9A1FA|nr:ABC transporter substrate-binding protein [Thiocapsa rosea]